MHPTESASRSARPAPVAHLASDNIELAADGEPFISAAEIERQLTDGGSHEDTRWATTAIRHAAPVTLPGDADSAPLPGEYSSADGVLSLPETEDLLRRHQLLIGERRLSDTGELIR